jgi:hypothetical protein
MNIKIGDFVLIQAPLFGFSNKTDLGPYIVEVLELNVDSFKAKHHTSETSCSTGINTYDSIIAKIHARDVLALFRENLL